MTQEEKKQLLLKDLGARLPHKVKVSILGGGPMELQACIYSSIGWYFDIKDAPTDFGLDEIKPYLRPMSSMTEKERKIVNKLIYNKESIWTSPIPVWVIDESDIEEYIDFCYSHHLDYRELIPMGLALEAPEDMYKIE